MKQEITLELIYNELVGHRSKFEQIDKRFEQIDKRFEQIDKRFDELTKEVRDIGYMTHMLMENAVHRSELVQIEKRLTALE